jgi:hypothetical protein
VDCAYWQQQEEEENTAVDLDNNDGGNSWLMPRKASGVPENCVLFYSDLEYRYFIVKKLPIHKFTEPQRHMRFMG